MSIVDALTRHGTNKQYMYMYMYMYMYVVQNASVSIFSPNHPYEMVSSKAK